METPYFTVVVREGHALVPRDDVVVDRQDGLRVDAHPRHLWGIKKMELFVLVIVHATRVAQACLVVPQTLDLAGENDVIARPHGLERRAFHFKVNVWKTNIFLRVSNAVWKDLVSEKGFGFGKFVLEK